MYILTIIILALSNMAGILYIHPNLLSIFCSILIHNEEVRELLESKDHSVVVFLSLISIVYLG